MRTRHMWRCVELGDAGIPRDIVVIILCRAWDGFQQECRHILERAVLAKLGANLGVKIGYLRRREKKRSKWRDGKGRNPQYFALVSQHPLRCCCYEGPIKRSSLQSRTVRLVDHTVPPYLEHEKLVCRLCTPAAKCRLFC